MAEEYSRKVLMSLVKQKKEEEGPSQKYQTGEKEGAKIIDIEEYRRLKNSLKQLHAALYN